MRLLLLLAFGLLLLAGCQAGPGGGGEFLELMFTIMIGFGLVVLVVGLRFVMRIAQHLERIEHHLRSGKEP